jgi:hypothetical protein
MNLDKTKKEFDPAEKKQDYVRASYALKIKIVDLVTNGRMLQRSTMYPDRALTIG